jgi:hypothetical protein
MGRLGGEINGDGFVAKLSNDGSQLILPIWEGG